MKKYSVIVKETLARIVTVDAESIEDAERQVSEQYENAEIIMNDYLIDSSVTAIPSSLAGKAIETVKTAMVRDIGDKFTREVMRLLTSGGVDLENFSVGTVFRAAIENVAEGYNFGKDPAYKKLKAF